MQDFWKLLLQFSFSKDVIKKKTMWVKPCIQVRPVCGAYSSLISDECAFRNYLQMNVAAFEDLLSRVEHVIVKQSTRWRASLSDRERPCITVKLSAPTHHWLVLWYSAGATLPLKWKTYDHVCTNYCTFCILAVRLVDLELDLWPTDLKMVSINTVLVCSLSAITAALFSNVIILHASNICHLTPFF